MTGVDLGLSDILDLPDSSYHAEALHARALEELQREDAAAARRTVSEFALLRPGDAAVLQLQAAVCLALHEPAQAIHALAQALKQNPRNASAWFNLGQALSMTGQWAHAVQAFDRVILLEPSTAAAWYGRSVAWSSQGEHGKAGSDAGEALRLEPGHAGALQQQGNTFVVTGQYGLALKAFAAVEAARPGTPFVAGMMLFITRQLCQWRPFDLPTMPGEQRAPAVALLRERAMRGEPALEPFAATVLYDDPALHRQAAGLWMDRLHPPAPAGKLEMPPMADGRLRVAYVSCDFYKHATAYLMAGLLEQHDRSKVEVLVFSYGMPRPDDAMRGRLQPAVDRWIDIHDKSDAQVAMLCRELGVHIAVDLKGLTRDSRPGIFARRAAPLQVNWLGYPGTMAAPYYDYLLADRVVIPEAQRIHYSEAIAWLPGSYQCNDDRRPIGSAAAVRERRRNGEPGLPPEGARVLCCFNNSFKITPDVWAVWMRLLRHVPNSVLWLLRTHDIAASNLREQARAHGVDPARLVFAPARDLPDHLARLQLADLSLDTLPCNAHTTASDALWAGVPHITCAGESFASRVGMSLLHAVGLPELVTHSLAAYEALALELLQDGGRLTALRAKLAAHRATAPLFDTAGFACNLERAFAHMHARAARGLSPEDFSCSQRLDKS